MYGGCAILDGIIVIDDIRPIFVTNPNRVTFEVEILNDKYVAVATSDSSETYTVSGDAEVVNIEGNNTVKVYGDCTISTQGSR